MLYGTITEFCSPVTCPRMLAGDQYEYLWQDPNNPKYKRATKVSAPEYIENLMTWVQTYFNNEKYFPSKTGVPFSKDAPAVFKTILKRLFRVYAHIYCHHFEHITELKMHQHLNTSLKHFVLFCNEFQLVDAAEFAPLQELIDIMLASDGK
ncbi:Mob1p [Sugiyamaella lignohabitans]|uniref:Mob1p n=1 Tax=Sugiyamaella lignohabitans TaxID=796027 RepID=A0A167CHN3_9ASCO|nr:Mob1p [Sugiyamaella lignohabitans]ANB11713.1 Mob1p [Sugiyamaella lignohabitans]